MGQGGRSSRARPYLDPNAAAVARPSPFRPIRWRAYPALLAAGCLAAGIAAAHAAEGVPFAAWSSAGACVLLASTLGALPRRRLVTLHALALTLCAGAGLVALGSARLALWRHLPADHVAHLAEKAGEAELTLTGRLLTAELSERRLRLTLEADSVRAAGRAHPVRGRIEASLWQPRDPEAEPVAYPRLRAGDRIALSGRLRPLEARRNPADFDYGAYLARRGVHATFAGYDSAAVAVLARGGAPASRAVEGVREGIGRALAQHVRAEEPRAVLRALLLADRSGIDAEVREAFVVTGLMHLLAVSGLHVLLVGMVLYGLLRPLLGRLGWSWRRTEVVRAAATLALLGLYVAVTGAPASATRAFVMAAVLIVGTAAERPATTLNSLGVAACVLLLARPTFLFDAGFQLSFAAVGGIVLLVPVFEAWAPARWRRGIARKWVMESLLVSAAATLGTMPVLLYHFGRVPLGGLVLNLPAIPLAMATLGAGIVCIATAGWAAPVADLAGAAAEASAAALLWTSRAGAEWLAWTSVGGYVRAAPWLAALVAALAVLALWPHSRRRWRMLAAAALLAALGAWLPVLRGEMRPALEVWFLDVGQGDAALLRLPGGRHVLVDAGLRDPYTDQGRRTVLPHLRLLGVRRLEALVVSHPHADHLGGVPTLLREVPVARLLHNGQPYASELFEETERLAEERGVESRALRAGDTLALDPAVRIEVLHPAEAPFPEEPANDGSLVLRLTYGKTTFLLTGDVEAAGEADLVAAYGEGLRSDVVKVAHHGSRTSSTPAFVRSAAGEGALAIVPVARRNVYRLPNEEVLARWDSAGATVLQTAREGAIWLRSDGAQVTRLDWR